jgi:hypothetical protein
MIILSVIRDTKSDVYTDVCQINFRVVIYSFFTIGFRNPAKRYNRLCQHILAVRIVNTVWSHTRSRVFQHQSDMTECGRSAMYFCEIPWLFQGAPLGRLLSFRECVHVLYIASQSSQKFTLNSICEFHTFATNIKKKVYSLWHVSSFRKYRFQLNMSFWREWSARLRTSAEAVDENVDVQVLFFSPKNTSGEQMYHRSSDPSVFRTM